MIRITFLGTAAARPTVGRNVSAIALQVSDMRIDVILDPLASLYNPLLVGSHNSSDYVVVAVRKLVEVFLPVIL